MEELRTKRSPRAGLVASGHWSRAAACTLLDPDPPRLSKPCRHAAAQRRRLDSIITSAWRSDRRQTYNDQNLLVGDTVARLFLSHDGRTVLAFRGMAKGLDWVTNTAGTISIDPLSVAQVLGARAIADGVAAGHRDVIFVGHSLGGRLAKVAQLATGRPAFSFNSAPFGSRDQIEQLTGDARTLLLRDGVPGSLTMYRSPDDPLERLFAGEGTVIATLASTGNPPGIEALSLLVNEIVPGGTNYAHDILRVVRAMEDIRTARDRGWFNAYLRQAR